MITNMEQILNKIQLGDRRSYKVHDSKGNRQWGDNVSHSIACCSWMGREQDILDYIEYIENHKED